MTHLLVGSVSDLLQLSDEAVDHQRPLQLLLVSVQISVELAPPGRDKTFKPEPRERPTEVKRVLPVVQLLPPLSYSHKFFSALSLLQLGCESVDGCDVSVVHRHFLQRKELFKLLYYYYNERLCVSTSPPP